MKLFPLTWQHHHLMIASTTVPIIQWQLIFFLGVDQYTKTNLRLDASLLQCTLRSSRCTGRIKMPNKLQWLRDRLTDDHALIGGFVVALLLAAVMWFLWIVPDLAMYFATGLIRLPPVF